MLKKILGILTVSILLSLGLGLGGCVEQDGPAEELGENIDDAAAELSEGAENACEELADGVDAEDANCG